MKVLVTGGNGYTAKRLISKLSELGWNVGVFVRDTKEYFNPLVSKIYSYVPDFKVIDDAFMDFKPDCVVHLASFVNVEHTPDQIINIIEANITIPTLILEAMNKHDVKRLVSAGTAWQHFEGTDNYIPSNLYAATKQSFYDICSFYTSANSFIISELRIMDIYGDNDNRPKLLNLLKRVVNGEIPLLEMTAGEQEVDLIHVDDVCDAIISTIKKLSLVYEPHIDYYRLGTNEIITVKQLVGKIQDLIGCNLPITFGGRPYRNREVMNAWRSNKTLPDWHHKITLNVGLSNMFKK